MNETMLENGLDFILDAAKQLALAEETQDDTVRARAIKYSLLHLLAGTELVMKARLYIENWTYIFADMNRADRQMLANGSLKTVDSSKCVDRLKRLCNIDLSEKDQAAFENLRKRRNCVEHFKVTDDVRAMEAVINKALSATMTFLEICYDEFSRPSLFNLKSDDVKEMTENENHLIGEITRCVAQLNKHYKDAVKLATELADKQGACLEDERLECPSCGEKLLVPDGGRCHCYLCGYEADGEEAARQYLADVKNLDEYRIVKYGSTYPLYTCPECGEQSFVNVGDKYECFSCRMNYPVEDIKFCSDCGEVYVNSNDNDECNLCPDCIAYKMDEWDKN